MCAQHGFAYFHWHASYHNLVLMASSSHLDSCDFAGSTTLVPLVEQPVRHFGQGMFFIRRDAFGILPW